MKKLTEFLSIVEKNKDFVLLKVDDHHCGISDVNETLKMNGFDGRESFIRIMFPRSNFAGNAMTWAVTLWYSGREPANTETFYFNDFTTNPPLVEFWVERLVAALKELCGVDGDSSVTAELKW